MDTQRLLHALGLNEKETGAYLACLEFGPVSMTDLARRSRQKRPTLYNIVEGLRGKGFIQLIRRNQKTLYDAERPLNLRAILRAREVELEHVLPELEQIRNVHQAVPTIKIYEGEEAVKNIYDVLYAGMQKREETYFLTSIEDLARHLPYAVDQYLRLLKDKTYNIRELLFDDEYARKFIKQKDERHIHTRTRLLPVAHKVHNDFAIQDETAYFFTFQHRLMALVIHDIFTVQTLKTLFEAAWENGKRIA